MADEISAAAGVLATVVISAETPDDVAMDTEVPAVVAAGAWAPSAGVLVAVVLHVAVEAVVG